MAAGFDLAGEREYTVSGELVRIAARRDVMWIDPRFGFERKSGKGRAAFSFRAAADFEAREPMTAIARIPFVELCSAVDAGTDDRAAFSDRESLLFMTDGWQSWSFAGEIDRSGRVRRNLLVRGLNAMTAHPARAEGRGEVLSHFFAWIRAGGLRLAVFSANSPDRALPPLSFAFSRDDLALSIEAYAEGASFKEGEVVAEVEAILADGYFELKDALRESFSRYRTFDRLAFLGDGRRLAPGGYESWYNHYDSIDDGIISGDLEAIGSNGNLINALYLSRGRPTVFQIDDGWESAIGDWSANQAKFPRGMAVLAQEIEARGMIPGLWIAPFVVERRSAAFRERADWILRDESGRPAVAGWNPLWGFDYYCYDLSIPEVEEYLAGVFDVLVEDWGYRYLKLDFLHAGMLRGARRRGGAAYECYDRVLRRLTSKLRSLRGRPLAYLGCGAPLEASFRHLPLMRIGADTREAWDWPLLRAIRHQGRPSAYMSALDTIGRSVLDGAVLINDPDVVFCRTSRMRLGEGEKELVALVDIMLASQLMFSDDTRHFGDEAAFTSRVAGLYDRLSGGEFGAELLGRDVFRVFSRDGSVAGVANLSNRPWIEPAGRWDASRAIIMRARRLEGSLSFEPRTVSLFER
jgi:alpha-galactosidase